MFQHKRKNSVEASHGTVLTDKLLKARRATRGGKTEFSHRWHYFSLEDEIKTVTQSKFHLIRNIRLPARFNFRKATRRNIIMNERPIGLLTVGQGRKLPVVFPANYSFCEGATTTSAQFRDNYPKYAPAMKILNLAQCQNLVALLALNIQFTFKSERNAVPFLGVLVTQGIPL